MLSPEQAEYIENLQKQVDLLIRANELQNTVLQNFVKVNQILLNKIVELETSHNELSGLVEEIALTILGI